MHSEWDAAALLWQGARLRQHDGACVHALARALVGRLVHDCALVCLFQTFCHAPVMMVNVFDDAQWMGSGCIASAGCEVRRRDVCVCVCVCVVWPAGSRLRACVPVPIILRRSTDYD